MPEGKANTLITTLRISGDIDEAVDKAVKKSKQDKPEWMRDALLEKQAIHLDFSNQSGKQKN